ncbi:ABC transporter substrate-binding protein [Chloroflexi bacterium TSY]|nr:ABC transporter substrate-binding protein [Chloroflexi bacterium TSY]
MNKRFLSAIVLILALVLSACSAPTPPASDTGGAQAAGDGGSGVAEFHPAWPYAPPPTGHFNTWVSNGMTLGIYRALMEPPLFMQMWSDGSWVPVAGESWEWVDDVTLRVNIVQGAKWSDGSDFTSQDVVDTFMISRLLSQAVWRFLDDVVAVDDFTVDFILTEPSTTVPRRVLREMHITASSVYGDFASQVAALVADGKTNEDEEWKSLLQEFNELRPEEMVVLGPYQIDPNSITESQMILNKVETSFMADSVRFDRMVNYNGETPVVTPLVLAGDVDYATHGFPPATEKEFQSLGYRIIRAPIYSGPALYFNHTIHPFEMKEVRQACMCGFSDNLTDLWLTDEAKATLNPYQQDLDKAEELLTSIGFTRDDDGVWLDDTGARMEWELTAPAEFSDWSAAAENTAEQLTAFGFKTAFRGVNFQQHPIDVNEGKFQLAIRGWGAGNPHPHFALNNNLTTHNAAATATGSAESGSVDNPGMSFDVNVSTDSVGDLNLLDVIDAAGSGNDAEAQKELISTVALAYNELLPQIPLWERYGNNPVPSRFASGWLPDDDPIYKNSPYADSFVVLQIMDGTLGPAE